MGQYHRPVCIEAAEGLDPHAMNCGLKEGEQGFDYPGTPHAMLALVCARGGNMPADCSQSPLIGKWAGMRVLVQGDYAEDTDIPGWTRPKLSKLYHAMTPEDERKPKKNWRSVPLFRDVTREVRDFLEAACNVRYFEKEETLTDGNPASNTYGQVIDRWTSTHSVHVKPAARHFGSCGVAEYVVDNDYYGACLTRDLEQLKAHGMQPIDVQRPPRSDDWHGVLPGEVAAGQTRVIVNLDTLEYLDPSRFGQVPTLAGMLQLPDKNRLILRQANPDWGNVVVSVTTGLFAMLCHPERRGGGDLPAASLDFLGDDPRSKKSALFQGATGVKGRWRGGRILATGEIRYEDRPTTEEVIERGTDISDTVIRYLVAVSHY
jgi:hypothetical protein